MKNPVIILALVVLFTLTSCSTKEVAVTPVFDAAADEKAIRSLLDQITAELAEADHQSFISHFHRDFTQFETWVENQYAITRDDVTAAQFPPMEWHYRDVKVVVTPDMALAKARVTFQIPPGPEEEAYDTLVLVKEDGQWYMLHGHLSYTP